MYMWLSGMRRSGTEATMEEGPAKIVVGAEFRSFEELQCAMAAFEEEQKITYWRRDARTFRAAKKRVDVSDNPALAYYEIRYACVKGGRRYEAKGSGVRPNQR